MRFTSETSSGRRPGTSVHPRRHPRRALVTRRWGLRLRGGGHRRARAATGPEPLRTSGSWPPSGNGRRPVSRSDRRSPATTPRWRRRQFPSGRPPWTLCL